MQPEKTIESTALPEGIAELLAAFNLAMIDDDLAELTRLRYTNAVRAFCLWYETTNQEPFEPERLTPIDLTSYRSAIQQSKSASTVNVAVAALRAFSAFLQDAGHRSDNPARKLKSVGRQQKLAPKSLSPNEVNALLRASQHARQQPVLKYAVAQLLLQTGIREAECSALNIRDVQISERQGQLTVRAGKGNDSRIVPINASARSALAAYLGPRWGIEPTVKAVAAVWDDHRDEPLFVNQRRKRLGPSGIWRMITGLVAATRPPIPQDTTPHTLRHTFGYHYLADHPGDLVGLAALLGHSSIEITRIYVEHTAEELARRVEGGRLNAY